MVCFRAIGLILCTNKNEAVARYTLSQTRQKGFVSRYQLHLPDVATLEAELRRERERLEQERRLAE